MEYDVIIVGGGPAGMLASIFAANKNKRVILIEKNNRLGKKLLITGKGRCNVTNHCSGEDVLKNVPRNGRFLYSCIDRFPPEDVMSFFEKNGCPLKVERGNRVFPVTDRSQSVLDCLLNQIKQAGIKVMTATFQDILTDEQGVCGIKTDRGQLYSRKVILATGGLSYPATGSTGDGFRIAEKLGHTVTPLTGSLVPLEEVGDDCKEMQGLSLKNVEIKLLDDRNTLLYKDFGELLFTHFGLSGPTVLSASAHLKGEGCKLTIDLKPALDEGKLDVRILRDLEQYKNRTMENALTDLLPRSMICVILRKSEIPFDLQANSLTKQQRRMLITQIKGFTVEIAGKRPVSEAIITSGGIKVSEINPKTMESKIIPGLYFAGEIIDCDAYTGGFNLQIAWSTGFAAGSCVKTVIDKP